MHCPRIHPQSTLVRPCFPQWFSNSSFRKESGALPSPSPRVAQRHFGVSSLDAIEESSTSRTQFQRPLSEAERILVLHLAPCVKSRMWPSQPAAMVTRAAGRPHQHLPIRGSLHDFDTGDFTSKFSDCRLLCSFFAVLPILDRVLNELLRCYLSSIAFLRNIGNNDLPDHDHDRQRNTSPSNGRMDVLLLSR